MPYLKSSQKSEGRIAVPDLTRVHKRMLLFRNKQHLLFWEAGPEKRKIWLELGEIPVKHGPLYRALSKSIKLTGTGIPLSEEDQQLIQTLPEVMDSFGFTEENMISVWQKYQLFDWEKAEGWCPFCRFSGGLFMKVISDRPGFEQGSLEWGGVWTDCIHKMFDENYVAI